MFKRYLDISLENYIHPGKILILYGPRRVGKTTLIQTFQAKYSDTSLLLNGEERLIKEAFSSHESLKMKQLIGSKKIIFLDEAQHIPHIGDNLKLLIDTHPDLTLVATGSSSFDLNHQIGEPLTGRAYTQIMYPISQSELINNWGVVKTRQHLEEFLLFGSYPEALTLEDIAAKKKYLESLVDSYLLRDAVRLEEIKYSDKLLDLLKLLAFQIGHEVSLTELASNLNLSRNTVVRYLYLLQKSFVIFEVRGFTRNLRSEIAKNHRFYFWDNGIRNAVISSFNPLSLRSDIGQLWENFLASERIKHLSYTQNPAHYFFWRTYSQQEIDWVEETENSLSGYEFKWPAKLVKIPPLWHKNYPQAKFTVINPNNYLDFLV